MTRALTAALGAVLFFVVATANSGGYRYGASDQAFYVPAVAAELNPALFPRDRALLAPQMRLWAGGHVLAAAARLAGGDLPAVFLAVYVLSLLLLAAGGIVLARSLGCDWWTVATFLVLLTLRHRIAKTGANSLEGYMHPRMLAFACGLFVLAAMVQRRWWLAAGATAIVAIIHPTTAIWFGGVLVLGAAWQWRHERRLWICAAVALSAGLLVAMFAGSARLTRMDAAWLQVLGDKDYLFSADWPLYAWAINLSYPAIVIALYRRRQFLGVTRPGETALVAGVLGVVLAFLLTLPLTQARIALVVQLQINRVFWLLDVTAMLYVAWWICALAARAWPGRGRALLAAILLTMACVRGYYVLHVQTGRPLIQEALAATPWTDVMAWLEQQPASWHVLADPAHGWKYGSSVRVAALRDTVLESGKDSAMAMYDRGVASRVFERARALATFDDLRLDDIQRLDAQYGLDVFVDRADRAFPLPELYRNAQFVVYDLR
ncbi:MAG: hypothetical protein ABI051_18140 [Vicinamibacterales bacterium]